MDVSVEKIAALAYLKLTDEEKPQFQKQFEDILSYFNELGKVPMSKEESASMEAFHVQSAFYESLGLETSVTLREDLDPREAKRLILTNEEALENAPQSSGIPGELLFEVPSIIEKKS